MTNGCVTVIHQCSSYQNETIIFQREKVASKYKLEKLVFKFFYSSFAEKIKLAKKYSGK